MEEKKNYFRDMSEFEYSEDYETFGKRWLKKSQAIMSIVWWLGLNCAWANMHFNENHQAEVLKQCIIRIRDYLRRKDLHYKFTESDLENLKENLSWCKAELYQELSNDIFDYCIRD